MKVCWACENPFPCAEHGTTPPEDFEFGGEVRDRPRTTQIRYEVGDPMCGTLANFTKIHDAVREAHAHQRTHLAEGAWPDDVTVFDRMAKRGETCKWSSDGRGIEKRQ